MPLPGPMAGAGGGPRPRPPPATHSLASGRGFPQGPYPVPAGQMADLMPRFLREHQRQLAQEKFVAGEGPPTMDRGKQRVVGAASNGYPQKPQADPGRQAVAPRGGPAAAAAGLKPGRAKDHVRPRFEVYTSRAGKVKGKYKKNGEVKFILVDWSSLHFTLGEEDLEETPSHMSRPRDPLLCLEEQDEFERLLAVIQ